MSRSRTGVVILRRRFDFWFGWLGSVGIVAAIAYATINAGPPYDARVAVGQIVFGAMAWLCWLVGPHPRIVVAPDVLLVVNWFTRTDMPWSAVASLEVESGRAGQRSAGQARDRWGVTGRHHEQAPTAERPARHSGPMAIDRNGHHRARSSPA
jgi:hypothetical protein